MLELPKKKYKTILIDPPWPVGSLHNTGRKNHKIKSMNKNYETLSIDEIKKLPIEELADESCSLFLWTTHTFLPQCFDIIHNWGFKYHCCITWDKGHGLCHLGFYRKTEFCLYAFKGKMNVNKTGKFIPTLLSERSRGHSKKPMILYEWLNNNTPKPRIELFARQRIEGWDAYGNELPNTIQKLFTYKDMEMIK